MPAKPERHWLLQWLIAQPNVVMAHPGIFFLKQNPNPTESVIFQRNGREYIYVLGALPPLGSYGAGHTPFVWDGGVRLGLWYVVDVYEGFEPTPIHPFGQCFVLGYWLALDKHARNTVYFSVKEE